ncbi:MAG: 2-hydroxyacid dehydrogenase [Jatrophihabitantaceae bacterium]
MITVCVPSPSARDQIEPVPDGVRMLVWDGTGDPPDGIADTEFLLGGYMDGPLAETVLGRLRNLRVIQLLSAGVETWLPLVPDGVTLCNGRGVHGRATAELAVTGILAIVRKLPFFLAEQADGRWTERRTEDVDGKRVLVLGAGEIGTHIAAALEVFGATTTFVARTARDGIRAVGDLPALLPDADILAIALPMTEQTRGLVDAGALALLPDRAIVANVARGAILDTGALAAEVVAAGRLRAFLDVTDPEPLPDGHPLWHAPDVVITPHVGGGTDGWQRRGYRLVREQLERYAAGEALVNVVGAGY